MSTTKRRKIARLTVQRAKRHTKASKNPRRKVRSLHSRKHQKLIKVGGRFNACIAYVLYDEIQSNFVNGKGVKQFINVPICIIFIVPNKLSVDDIYLFFNKNITANDIKLTVKLLLGIDPTVDFNLTPDIPTPSTNTIDNSVLGKFISNTFVKLTSCGTLSLSSPKSFCLKTGTLSNNNIELDKVNTTHHNIQTTNTTYKSLNGEKIKDFLARSNPEGFMKKVLDSKAILPDLYKKYFIEVSKEDPELSEDEINKYYKNDLEPNEKPWRDDLGTYDAFKERMKQYIRETILHARKHKTYGLDSNSVEILNKNRPLNITDPIDIQYCTLDARSIILSIDEKLCNRYNCSLQFTDLLMNWWEQEEEEEVKDAERHVASRKKARITPCEDWPLGTNCHEFHGMID